MDFLEHCVVGMNFSASAFIKFVWVFFPAIFHALTASSRALALVLQIISFFSGYCVLISCFLLYVGTKTHFGMAYTFLKTVYTVSSFILTKAAVYSMCNMANVAFSGYL